MPSQTCTADGPTKLHGCWAIEVEVPTEIPDKTEDAPAQPQGIGLQRLTHPQGFYNICRKGKGGRVGDNRKGMIMKGISADPCKAFAELCEERPILSGLHRAQSETAVHPQILNQRLKFFWKIRSCAIIAAGTAHRERLELY